MYIQLITPELQVIFATMVQSNSFSVCFHAMIQHDQLLYLKNISYMICLLPCNIPTTIVKPFTVINYLVFSPLDDKDKSYYTALSKQSHSYDELLFISAEIISYMVQTENKAEHKPLVEQTAPICTTSDKLSSILNNRTLRDITQLLDPYKRNQSDSPITTLTHLKHCHDRTHKLLKSLDLDSQRVTQSSQAIQSALDYMTNLFNSTNLLQIST